MKAIRVQIDLDAAHAEKLERLAERARTRPERLAASLLATALDDALSDPGHLAALLDAIDGAYEALAEGNADFADGRYGPLETL